MKYLNFKWIIVVYVFLANPALANVDVCSGLPQTGLLCRIAAAGELPTDALPARALGSISAFVAATLHHEDTSTGGIERRLFSLVPEPARSRCINAAKNLQNPRLGEAILCLRPACLTSSPAPICKPIVNTLLDADIRALRSISQGLLKDCSKAESCSLSAEAIELVVATDALRTFVLDQITSTSWPSFCPESSVPVCSKRLADLAEQYLRRYANAAAWHLAIQQLNSSRGTWAANFLASPEVTHFEQAWAEIQKTIDRRNGDAEANDLFVLTPGMQEQTKKLSTLTESLSIVANSLITDERINVTNQLIADSRVFFQTAGAIDFLDKDLRVKFEQLPKGPVSRKDSDWRNRESLARELSNSIQNIQQKLAIKLGGDTLSENQKSCASEKPRLDANGGILEFCYPVAKGTTGLQIVGLKFHFVPCRAPLRNCDTDGDFQILWRLNNGPVVARSLGLNGVASSINTSADPTGTSPIVVLKSHAPNYSFRHFDDVTLATIREILPSPISLTFIRSEVIDGPEVRIELSAGLDFDGLRDLQKIQLRLSRDGLSFENGAKSQDVVGHVQTRILEAIRGSQIKHGPFEVVLKNGNVAAECPNKFGFNLLGDLKLPGGLKTEAALKSCGQSLTLSVNSLEATLRKHFAGVLNNALSTLPKITAAQVDESSVKIYASNNDLRLLTNVKVQECATVLDFSLSQRLADQFSGNIVGKIAQCVLANQLKNAPVLFKFGEIPFKATDTPGVFCTEKETPIGRFCVSGVKEPYDQIDAELQSDGEAVRKLTNALQPLVGDSAVVKQLKVSKSRVVAILDVTLPFIGKLNDLNLTITNSGILSDIRPLLRAAVNTRLSELTAGNELTIAGVKLRNISLTEKSEVSFAGQVSYGGFLATADIEILPKFNVTVRKPSVAEALNALKPVLGLIADVNSIDVVDTPDGIPALNFDVKVGMKLFDYDFSIGTVVEARTNGKLRFAGPVSLTLPQPWIPLSYVAVGRIRGRVDLNEFKDVTVGASLTLAPGEGTYEIIGVDGDLHVGPRSVDLNAVLKVISLPLGQSVGSWRFREGMLEVNVGTSSLPDIIPLPSGHLIIDGQACAFAGSASAKLMGAQLASVGAGVLVGSAICKVGAPRDQLISEIIKRCGSRGPLAQLCLFGAIKFGDISGSGLFSTRLDQIVPNVSGQFDLAGLAKFEVGLNASRAKLETSVLGFRLKLILPSVDGLNEAFLRRLIENLLKSSIDLDALLRGDIQINPAAKGGRSDDAMVDDAPAKDDPANNTAKSPEPNGNIKGPPAPPKQLQTPPSVAGDYEGPRGTIQLGLRQFGSTAYWQVMERLGQSEVPRYSYLFSNTDAERLRKGTAVFANYLDGIDVTLSDGSTVLLACTPWPCTYAKVSAIRAYRSPETEGVKLPESLSLNLESAVNALKNETFASVDASDGFFNYPALMRILAERAIKGESDAISAVCLPSADEPCEAGLIRRANSRSLLERWRSNVRAIQPDSLAGQLLDKACSQECDPKKTPSILKRRNSDVLALAKLNGAVLSLHSDFVSSNEGQYRRETTLEQINLNDFSITKSWKVSNHVRGATSFSIWDSSVDHPLLQDLLVEISSKVPKEQPLNLFFSSEQYASAITGSGASETIWSAVRQGDKSCIRQAPVVQILAKIADWSRTGKMNAQFAVTISTPDNRNLLLDRLATPTNSDRSEKEFFLSPLLLFGDVGLACK